jgi:hypothetical protein
MTAAGLALTVRSDYESVVTQTAGCNPKGAAEGATGSIHRGGIENFRGEIDWRGGCDFFVRIVTTAAMVGNFPPAATPEAPDKRQNRPPLVGRAGTEKAAVRVA